MSQANIVPQEIRADCFDIFAGIRTFSRSSKAAIALLKNLRLFIWLNAEYPLKTMLSFWRNNFFTVAQKKTQVFLSLVEK